MTSPPGRKVVLIGLDAVSLPLVEHCLRGGARLPAFERLLADGVAAEAVSELPAYTPTNWAVLATGARVGATGAADWVTDTIGTERMSTFDSRAISAQTIFEVCSDAGVRSLAIQYPGSWPRRGDGMVVAPLPKGLVSFALAGGIELLSDDVARPGARLVAVSDWDQGSGSVATGIQADVSVLMNELNGEAGAAAERRAGVKADGAAPGPDDHGSLSADLRPAVRLTLRMSPGDDGSIDAAIVTADGGSVALVPSTWSDWLRIEMPGRDHQAVQGTVRFNLRWVAPDGRRFSLVRSEIYPIEGFTDPPELAQQLIAEVGPFIESPTILALGQIADDSAIDALLGSLADDLAISFEEAEYQARWIVQAAELLEARQGWDLLYLHWHFPDTIIHRLLAAADSSAPGYRADLGPTAEWALRRCLEIADGLVAGMRSLAGAEGYAFVVSDHGNVSDRWTANVVVRLVQAGLAAALPDGTLDRARSQVVPFAPLQLRVQAAHTEDGQPVDVDEYERLQEAAIDALLNWRDPVHGKRVVALALKRQDSQLLGFWGPTAGDVIYCLNDAFSWTDGPPVSLHEAPDLALATLFPVGAHHGSKLPTARSSLSSNMAILLAAGPGIRRGHRWDGDRVGWPRLVDVVPTICHLLGIRPPRQAHGAIISGLFEDESRT